jgi:hypothetical protein
LKVTQELKVTQAAVEVSFARVAVQSPAALPPAVIVPFAVSPLIVPVISIGICCPFDP